MSLTDLTNTLGFDAWKWSTGLLSLLVYHCLPFKPFNTSQAKNESRLKKKTEAETLAIGVWKGWKRDEERNTTQGHDRPCLLCMHLCISMLCICIGVAGSPENGTKEHDLLLDSTFLRAIAVIPKFLVAEAEKEAAVEQVSGRPVATGVAFGLRTCLGRGTRDTWWFMSWDTQRSNRAKNIPKPHVDIHVTWTKSTLWFCVLGSGAGDSFFFLWRSESRQQLLVTLDGCHFGHFLNQRPKYQSCYAHADSLAMTLHLKQPPYSRWNMVWWTCHLHFTQLWPRTTD